MLSRLIHETAPWWMDVHGYRLRASQLRQAELNDPNLGNYVYGMPFADELLAARDAFYQGFGHRYRVAGWCASAMAAMTVPDLARGFSCVTNDRIWDDYFATLDAVLNAGPQGEPWSADIMDHGTQQFAKVGGRLDLVS